MIILESIVKNMKDVSLAKENGKFLADKSYAYDTLFFIAKFIVRNAIGKRFNKEEQKQRAIDYIEEIFNLTDGTAGAVNYFYETLNLLEFGNVIEKTGRYEYKIIREDILDYICFAPENAYIFIYILTYMTCLNDGLIPLYTRYCNTDNLDKKLNIYIEIIKQFNEKSISIKTADSQWANQLVKYSLIVLGFANEQNVVTRTPSIKEKILTVEDISLNIEGTRTPIDLRGKKNDYIKTFSPDYVKDKLKDFLMTDVHIDQENNKLVHSIASELAEIKLDMIDMSTDINVKSDFDKEQYIKNKGRTRNQAVQREFKKNLLSNNVNVCPICGFSFKEFLIASHIKPYALCDNTYDAINHYNGLLLCPNHDKLFEGAKYMTIDSSTGKIILSEYAKESKDFADLDGRTIDIRLVNCERTHYLRWHNSQFKKIREKTLSYVRENNKNYLVAEDEEGYKRLITEK